MGPTPRRLVALLALWAAALVGNRSLRRVRGGSMLPTLAAGDLVAVLPVRRPRRGEVVLVRDPRDRTHVQVKRVVGLPGELVEIHDGQLLLDGHRHDEPHRHGRGPDGALTVPSGHVVVLGDARDASTDSRVYGPVPLELVDRRVPLRLLPRPRWLRSTPVPTGDPDGRRCSASR